MTEEEKTQWVARLREAGWDPATPEWVRRGPVDLAQLPTLQRQRELLGKIRELLNVQLARDLDELDAARRTAKSGGSDGH